MRKRGRSALVVVGAVAVGAAVVAAIWHRADASASRAEELQTLCEKTHAYHRRAAALAELIELDSSASRASLEALAAAKDAELAAQALAAIGRAEKADGRSWSNVEATVGSKVEGNEKLEAMAAALEDRVFATTGGGR